MTVFVDTSALYALLDADDARHAEARAVLTRLAGDDDLTTHDYVVVESSALVQRRLGGEALRDLHRRLLSIVAVARPAPDEVAAATTDLLIDPGGPSLVDRLSFEFMRRRGIDRAFSFDRHFADEGFADP